jgi:hypothetical protein
MPHPSPRDARGAVLVHVALPLERLAGEGRQRVVAACLCVWCRAARQQGAARTVWGVVCATMQWGAGRPGAARTRCCHRHHLLPAPHSTHARVSRPPPSTHTHTCARARTHLCRRLYCQFMGSSSLRPSPAPTYSGSHSLSVLSCRASVCCSVCVAVCVCCGVCVAVCVCVLQCVCCGVCVAVCVCVLQCVCVCCSVCVCVCVLRCVCVAV